MPAAGVRDDAEIRRGGSRAAPSLAIVLGDDDPTAPASGTVLAEIRYGASNARNRTASYPVIELDLPPLARSPVTERWTTSAPITYLDRASLDTASGDIGGMRLAMNGDVLFGHLPGIESPGDSLDALVYRGYRAILGETWALGYPHLLRVWNYFPDINREQAGLERYQQFCLGRYRAFAEGSSDFRQSDFRKWDFRKWDFRRHLPAATAIGTRSGPVQIYFLAGKTHGLHVENPRQVSAYKYPPLYGPRSPSFARATLYASACKQHLFIAGTSSIVGHASRHPGDPYRQAVETLRNIETVIATARSLRDGAGRPIGLTAQETQALLKVYVRHPEDFPVVQSAFDEHLRFPARCLYLSGAICRANLLVEAEALIGGAEAPGPAPALS
ncbi:MAG: chorismate transformation enzyme, FkbO/Hyg5 family [Gammaproteobacteria bacterium]